MGYNTLTNGLQNRGIYSAPGCLRFILVPSEDVQGYEVVSGSTVNAVRLYPTKKYHLFDDIDDISYLLTNTRTKSGPLYQLDLGFTVPIQTGAKNVLFDQMADTELVAIVQDANSNWWLLGHDQPLKLVTGEQKIDNDTNGYTIKLSTKQSVLPLHMSAAWINNLNTLPFSTLVDSIDGAFVPISVQVPTTNGNLPTGFNYQNIIVNPPTNYVIEPNIGTVFAGGGKTVKLPTNPSLGQEHTIKDYLGVADLLPITLDGNGRLIDELRTFQLNTKDAAVKVMFNGLKWGVVAFVN